MEKAPGTTGKGAGTVPKPWIPFRLSPWCDDAMMKGISRAISYGAGSVGDGKEFGDKFGDTQLNIGTFAGG